MKRTLLSLLFIISMSFAARAQWVAIPDSGFGNYLAYYAGPTNAGLINCMMGSAATGWMLDTTCSDVLNTTGMNFSGLYQSTITFTDITGVQYFTNLDYLDLSGGFSPANLTIPPLPNKIKILRCTFGNGARYNFTTMPDSLQELAVQCFATLPYLPNGVKYMYCANLITNSLPSLPDSLRYLDLAYSDSLTILPPLPAVLETLVCNNTRLNSLPALPLGLKYLNCAYSEDTIRSLPALGSSLIYLDCSRNYLTSLPVLPASLTYLDCSYNYTIASLPALPDSLKSLFFSANAVSSVPLLPAHLSTLDCSNNPLFSLPNLPSSLLSLACNNDSLTSLPASLPPTLVGLSCEFNALDSLPRLPATIQVLHVSICNLNALPALPDSLQELSCDRNHLSSLPVLPTGLISLYTGHNNLSSLPDLPQSIRDIDIAYNYSLSCLPRVYSNNLLTFFSGSTGIHCLPNSFTAGGWDVDPTTYPLCDAASGCDFYFNIAGNVHQDTAASCLIDSLHPGAAQQNMKVQLLSNGNVVQQFYTFNSGGYSFKTDSLVTYTVRVDTAGIPLYTACPAAGQRTIVLSHADSVEANEGFGMKCRGVDFSINNIYGNRFRPGIQTTIVINGGDLTQSRYGVSCGAGISGTVTTTLDTALSYVGSAVGALSPSSVVGNVLTYNVSDLESLSNSDLLDVIVSTSNAVTVGSQVCISTAINPSVSDINTADNTLTQCFTVRNSYDPNLKEVYPSNVTQDNQYLTYTIHFQNTGNDTAYTVIVKDTLSQYLDASSFQYLASSHHAVIQLFGNAMVFTFPKINLVDSATNPPLSEGWIQYKVRTNAHVPNGSQIANTASIYFDLNPAIVTNTVISSVQTCVTVYDTSSIVGCAGVSYLFGGAVRTAAGYYTDTMQTTGGCDSVVTLHLIVMPNTYDTISHTMCAGDSFIVGAYVHRIAGTFNDTIQTNSHCDSIVTLHLRVKSISHDTISQSLCAGDSVLFGGTVYHQSGYYSLTLTGANGCDSIVTLHLTVNALPVVSLSWDTLVHRRFLAFAHGGISAKWCAVFFPDTIPLIGGLPIGGVYSGRFVSGDSLIFTFTPYPDLPDTIFYTYTDAHGCTATGSNTIEGMICDQWPGGINNISASLIRLYPNPNTGTFTLETTRHQGDQYTIYDMLGQVIQEQPITADTQHIDLTAAAGGIYTLVIKGSNGSVRFTVMK